MGRWWVGGIRRLAQVTSVIVLFYLGCMPQRALAEGHWGYATVDSAGDVGRDGFIALDAHGYPHISYYDATHGDLKYARATATGWQTETVDSEGDVGRFTWLVLDGDDRAHISYYDVSGASLKLAHQDATGWRIERVDWPGDVGTTWSLALDSRGQPHIVWADTTKCQAMYAYRTAAGWITETLGACEASDDYIVPSLSIALDGDDVPHVTYTQFGSEPCQYCYWWTTYYGHRDPIFGWQIESINRQARFGPTVSCVAVGTDGLPGVIVSGWCPPFYTYRRSWRTGDWARDTPWEAPWGGMGFPDLRIDSEHFPHAISLYYGLEYWHRDAFGWHRQPLPEHASAPSLALNNLGQPHIAYYDAALGDLAYTWSPATAAFLVAGPGPFRPGWDLYYTLHLTNTGVLPLTGLLITDTLPVGLCCAEDGPDTSASGVWEEGSGTMTWRLDSVPAGQTVRIALVARSAAALETGAIITNTFQYTAAQLRDVLQVEAALVADAKAPLPTPSGPAVSLAAGPDPFYPGWNLYYTLHLTNTNAVALTNLTVSDTLPVGLCCAQDGAGTSARGVWDQVSRTMTWRLDRVASGESASIALIAHSLSTLSTGTVISNTFQYTADQFGDVRHVAVIVVADTAAFPRTPTATTTPSATPMPTALRGLALPLILR